MNVHFIGIGGVGMAGLAVLLKSRGHDVSGCDLHPGPRTAWLLRQGIPVATGHDPAHLTDADVAIVTPAVRPDNAERCEARCVRLRGEMLAEVVSAARDSIAVCGSHGKTTTATWIAKLLMALGEHVEWAIGGETGDFPVAGISKGGSAAAGAVLVVEADESDGTLAQYHAKTLVVTNCEYDHPDHFKTRADYEACYEAAKRNAADIVEGARLEMLSKAPDPDRLACLPCLLSLAPHNRQNACVAIEVALRRGHPLDAVLAALPAIVATLPDRRFQRVWPIAGKFDGSTRVIADYAHHPTEMRCAIQMAREICPGTLRVLFQPHRYSRTKALLSDFPSAFAGADEVLLCPTYAAFESPVSGGDVEDLYRECCARHTGRFALAPSCEAAWNAVRPKLAKDDVTLLLGAGDIIGLVPKIQRDLSIDRAHL